MKLFDYQEKAVKFIGKEKKVYLAIDMGMGKTLTSLAAAERFALKNVLVIAEKNEIVNSENFKTEVDSHFAKKFAYTSLREKDLDWVRGSSIRNVCGINPEGLAKLDMKEIEQLFDFVIVDEATMAKTTTTDKFQRVKRVCSKMDYVVLLSGTPMMNGASELFAPLILMDHSLAGAGSAKERKAFETIFAGGFYKQIKSTKGLDPEYLKKYYWKYYSWWAKGANNVRELRKLVSDKFFFIKKSETEIFKSKERLIERVEMSEKWKEEYTTAWNEYLESVKGEKTKQQITNITDMKKLIENGRVYQVNSKWKSQRVVEDIAAGKYEGRRIIVFTLFIESYDLIIKGLENKGIGFRTFDELQEWRKGDEQVLVGRIRSHNKGGNVPEASGVIFVDMDFVPANNIQAENRIDRPEQKRDMIIRYYFADGGEGMDIDEHVQKINKDKVRKIEKFMEQILPEEETVIRIGIEAIKQKYPNEWGQLTRHQMISNIE